jgi:hypothetical protein
LKNAARRNRLTSPDWNRLRNLIDFKQVRVIALDLPMPWSRAAPAYDFAGRMFAAVNAMMLGVLTDVTRKDSGYRRRRQAERTAKAKAVSHYTSPPTTILSISTFRAFFEIAEVGETS